MTTRTLDPNAGTAALPALVMTAKGLVPREYVEAYLREEAARMRTQEPQEPTYV
jgi:hypothetical protein